MNLAGLLDVDHANAQDFFDLNAMAHETVFAELLRLGVIIEHFPLWTSEPPPPDWSETHYREHLAWSRELGLAAPPDLSAPIDLDNNVTRSAWLYNHLQHHDLVAQVLSL